MSTSPLLQSLVSSLVQQAPNRGIHDLIQSVVNADKPQDSSIGKGLLAGLVGGVVGTLAKTLTERYFPITPPDPTTQRTIAIGDQELSVNVNTREWMVGLLVGGAYGAAAELAPEVTVANGLGLGSALYGLNNAGETATPEQVQVSPQEENEGHELLSDMVFGLVTELVRTTLRSRLDE